MQCGCKDKTNILKVQGNRDLVSPIWCDKCGWNIKLDELQISNELKSELISWNLCYRKLINPKTGEYIDNWIEFREQYDRRGCKLSERLQLELKEEYIIRFESFI
ncbi:hypothetical protein HBE96_11900 [Clostridium sp. P21]|uniref:Uncharacterized protein n=1 Tax=Clostridium muellerianum TaxID=2716538 RepID=A0A7Y0EH69_9CLOT|nr:hypothetical protein [Clostridium muellerianum]NMM63368.1 hypothetical protein [Clostridium muellerianum]